VELAVAGDIPRVLRRFPGAIKVKARKVPIEVMKRIEIQLFTIPLTSVPMVAAKWGPQHVQGHDWAVLGDLFSQRMIRIEKLDGLVEVGEILSSSFAEFPFPIFTVVRRSQVRTP
jgi:hypothetical protein